VIGEKAWPMKSATALRAAAKPALRPRRRGEQKKRTDQDESVRNKQTLSEIQKISFITTSSRRDWPGFPNGKRMLKMTPNDKLLT
jgi:hypothetical protein